MQSSKGQVFIFYVWKTKGQALPTGETQGTNRSDKSPPTAKNSRGLNYSLILC